MHRHGHVEYTVPLPMYRALPAPSPRSSNLCGRGNIGGRRTPIELGKALNLHISEVRIRLSAAARAELHDAVTGTRNAGLPLGYRVAFLTCLSFRYVCVLA